MPSYSGGAPVPFVPGVYQPDSTIAQMILRAGAQRAELQQRGAEQLAGTVQRLGDVAAGTVQQIAEAKKAQALKAQDQAFMARVSDPKAPPLTVQETVRIYGPERGMAIFKAYGSLQSDKPDLKTILAGFEASTPDMRAAAWPRARQHLVAAKVPEEALPPPDQYDDAWFQRFKGAVSGAPALQKGSPGDVFFDPAHPEAGPKLSIPAAPPKPPNLQHVETAAGIQTFDPEKGTLGPVIAQGKPSASAAQVSIPTGTVDAERPDPATANAIDRTTGLTGNALYQNAATYALTGHMPAMGMGGKGPVTAARMAIQNKAGAIAAKAGIDLPTLQAEYRANSGTLAKLLPQAQATANFANTAKDNLALALGQSPKVTRTDSAWINSVANAFVRGATPAAPLTKFETYIFTAAREYAKVTTGGAMSAQALSDTATKEATKLLNASQSPEAFAAATQAMQDDMDNVIKRQTEGMAKVSSTIANFFGAANNVPVGAPASPAPTHAAPTGPAPIIQRNTDTGEYRHSLDGGKTWKPGKP